MGIITSSTIVNATKEKIWEAITNPKVMKIWYFDILNFNLAVANEFSFYEGDKKEFLHTGEILEVSENEILKHTWKHPEQSKGSSIVTWTIEELENEKVRVTLSHEGLESFADGGSKFAAENYQMGWDTIVKTNLRNYLYNIEKLTFAVQINASAETIWTRMWDKKSYTDWTTAFCNGSYFTGEIAVGNRIHFMDANHGGM